MAVKAIVFDLGGVLIGFDQRRIARQLAKHCDAAPDEIFEAVFESGIERPFETGVWTGERFHREVCERLGTDIPYEDFMRIWCDMFWPHKEVIDLVRSLRGAYRLVLLSNTDELHINHIDRTWHVLDMFDDFVLSFKVGRAKPDPMIYQLAIQKAHARPDECIFVDDRAENVAAAAQLGMLAFVYKDPEQLAGHLKELGVRV